MCQTLLMIDFVNDKSRINIPSNNLYCLLLLGENLCDIYIQIPPRF